jgi:hypothetical protein
MIKENDTATNLRLLAKELEDGNASDFCFCFIRDGKFYSAHKAEKDVFGLIGIVSYRLNEIHKEIE